MQDSFDAQTDAMVDRDEQAPGTEKVEIAGEEREERVGELSRLISLSDGVFAFAMTLLVVSIEIPDLSDSDAKGVLARDLWDTWPQVISYVIGFLVIAFMWGSHRRTFARIRDYDDTLVKLNILLLMFVAFLPFPTGILGEYGDLAIPAVFYAVILLTISVLFIVIIDHLDQHRELMTRRGKGFDFPRAKTRHLVTAGIFLLSIPAAFAFPGFGQLIWILLAFNHKISEVLLPHLPGRFHERPGQA
ncbi:MAG: TMEM175 family protein [Thermomicrobiales bacterium]